MKYYLFIDETGDHGLTTLNPDFPLFLLCGALIAEQEYEKITSSFNTIKTNLWGNKSVIFHSRDIRKCEKEFSILFDLEKKKWFYENLNAAIANHNYTIIASAIQKDNYIKKFGKLSNDVYELALSFIIERAIFYLDGVNDNSKKLFIVIEKRGKKEDKKLDEHFQRLLARGTSYVSADRLRSYSLSIHFKNKKENINGLQLADLIAYPIARNVIEPYRANPAYDIVQQKIYNKNGKRYGLKIYP
ncbi:MAG: DUF3800 domain-containing protein [Bacteroidota bacterium]